MIKKIFVLLFKGWVYLMKLARNYSSSSSSSSSNSTTNKPQKFYCEYCGDSAGSIKNLVMNNCTKHPNGFANGPHKVYEGSEKSQYTCKYCGESFKSIKDLVMNNCTKHPNGFAEGRHAPMK